MMEDLVPEYDLIKSLGEGGQSHVWLGKKREDGSLVAIKMLCCTTSVAQEAKIMKELHHSSIPRLYEYREMQGKVCLILEYVAGENLREYLEREGPLPDSLLLRFAANLCDIFLYLHGLNPPVIYRDLKPGNLILTRDGRLVLIDFGSARFYSPGARTDTVYLGTRGYAAPELYGGLGQSDIRTDIYAFGMTLYHLRSGETPPELPEGGLFAERERKDLLEKLMEDCTEADPNHRLGSFEEIRERLAAISEGDGRGSCSLESLQTKKWKGYPEKLGFFCCLSGVLLLCFCTVFFFQARRKEELPGLLLVSDEVTGLVLCHIEQLLDSGISEKRLFLLLDHTEERLYELEKKQEKAAMGNQKEEVDNDEEVMFGQILQNLERSRRLLLATVEKREGIG